MIRILQVIAFVSTLFSVASPLSVLPSTQTNSLQQGTQPSFLKRQPIGSVNDSRGPIARDASINMSTVLDRPDVKTGGGPAVLDRPEVEQRRKSSPTKERKRVGSEAWEVRIYNDGMNTREFVARCLVQITQLSEITAYQTMMLAHQNGVAVVGRYIYEIAEMYHGELKKNGIVCDLVPVDEER